MKYMTMKIKNLVRAKKQMPVAHYFTILSPSAYFCLVVCYVMLPAPVLKLPYRVLFVTADYPTPAYADPAQMFIILSVLFQEFLKIKKAADCLLR